MKKAVKIASIPIIAALVCVLGSVLFLPDPLFDSDYSTVIYDRNGQLMGGRVAADEQWRFPRSEQINEKFATAIMFKEDKYFYKHPGFNPVSMLNALRDNMIAGRVVRGGSTITMQTIRLARRDKPRTIREKLIEVYLGIGLELTSSKQEILSQYCAHAPFGGNVVGLEAASWRYFGHHPDELSWGEAALLAVLPNAPALIHPGKNRDLLKEKRNNLLNSILQAGEIDSLTYVLSLLEPLPEKPVPMPQKAPHLLSRYHLEHSARKVNTTLDGTLQTRVAEIVDDHRRRLSENEIHNAAVLILDPETYEVIAYVANTSGLDGQQHGNQVDMIQASRSTGSILKPLLYAAMIEQGMIMPDALVPDIPSYYDNYYPENFDLTYEGAVPASKALSRSRNVPSVYMLRDYGGLPFLHLLKKVGLTTFDKPAGHYGLTLILGGGEASLWELTNMYAGMARTLINYDNFYSKYTGLEYKHPILELEKKRVISEPEVSQQVPLHAATVWLTFDALQKVKRPESERGWEGFRSSLDIAWKTGTSYGYRDAWAIGTTPDYVVGVWVGNADGEGRDGLTGTRVAAPLMFEVFGMLQAGTSFHPPYDEFEQFVVCDKSGYRASRFCPEVDTVFSYEEGFRTKQCDYHQLVFTDEEKKYRYNQDCAPGPLVRNSWFVLPPVQEWYYRKLHPTYQSLPPWSSSCYSEENTVALEFIYPMESAKVFVPVGIDEQPQEIVLEVTNRYPGQKVYWHLDNEYLGETEHTHQLPVIPDRGWHTVTVVNETGESNSVRFEVVGE